MADWLEIIEGAGKFLGALANVNVISEWLKMDETDALNSIEEFVRNVSTERIDSMDADLLNRCNFEFDAYNRTRLIKFYAMFKLVEFVKYQKFRGFPN